MEKKNLELVTALRHELHTHPELSGQEVWTRKRLMDFLREHTKLEVVDRGNWFYAKYSSGSNRPGIAFRADFDALPIDETISLPYGSQFPGTAHKCGHDGHSATMCGFALEVDQKGADRDIYFIFQHAEEIGAGAVECAPVIDECGISEIYGYHNMANYPVGSVALRNGTMFCASTGMIISFKGTSAHASLPENGHNPALAIADLIRLIPDLIKPGKNKGLVLCTVIQVDIGEQAFGVSAHEGKLLLTCRGQYEDEMNVLIDTLKAKSEEFAKRDGLKVSFSFCDTFPETANDATAADKVRTVCSKLNIPVTEMPDPVRSSEDMGHFLKRAKGAFFLIGIGDRPPIHDEKYDFLDDIIEPAVTIYQAILKEAEIQ